MGKFRRTGDDLLTRECGFAYLSHGCRVFGIFWKCARVGERLSPYVGLCCVMMAVSPCPHAYDQWWCNSKSSNMHYTGIIDGELMNFWLYGKGELLASCDTPGHLLAMII